MSASPPPGSSAADDDITIPRAAMNKMIKELCPNIRVSNDAREMVLNCCTEFIHLLSSEANEICNNQQKKTISPEHVLLGEPSLDLNLKKKEKKSVDVSSNSWLAFQRWTVWATGTSRRTARMC